jgi:hypothetical protein
VTCQIRQQAPAVHLFAHAVDDGGVGVALFLVGKPLALVKQGEILLLGLNPCAS